jgi:hypothetical protein
MVGKKMRCKACASVFAIEAPTQEPSLSAASVVGADSHVLGASDLTGTRRAQHVPPPQPPSSQEDEAPVVEENRFFKPTFPQDFPGAAAVEAWVPLGLGLISAVWVISQTFGSNDTDRLWVPVLRLGVVGLLYLGLVIPITYRAMRISFRAMRRLTPPNPGMRTALTFALPAALGYEMWQASGGAGGFFMGLILGVAMMAVVYWLLFRLNQQETANSYARVAGTFVAGCAVSAVIVVAASAILNRAMVAEHAGLMFKESPLGEPLAWNTPKPEPKPVVRPAEERVATPQPPEPAIPRPNPSSPAGGGNTQVARNTDPSPPAGVAPEPTVRGNGVVEPVVNPPSRTKTDVFVKPDEDSFTDSIRRNNFPWVKSITRADGQATFDFTVSSSGQSQFIGLVSLPDGRLVRQILLAPMNAAVPVFQDDLEQAGTFGARYVLTNDGKALIHLRADNTVRVIPTAENRQDLISLEAPVSAIPTRPSLVGTSKGATFVVRWAAPQTTEQFVYRYDYLAKMKLSKTSIPKDPYTTPAVFAVSDSESSPVLYAWLSQFPGRPPQVRIVNLTASSGSMSTRSATFPADISDVTLFERGEMSFSPDGSMLAMVLEQGNTARVMAWSTANPVNSPAVRLTCKCPSSSEMGGHVRGPSVRWINQAFFVAYGRNVIGAGKHGVIGNLSDTDTVITAEQTTPDGKLYISYMLPDMHLHLAAIEFDPHELIAAPVVSATGH